MQQATSRLRARGAAIATFGLTLLAPLAAHAGEIPTAQDVENVDPFFRGAREVRALDWDRDGRLDVVGIGIVEGSASYWRNGEFGWIENGLAGFGPYTSLDIGDLNGDGTTDVVYTIGDSAATNDRVGGYLNRPGILGFPIALGDEVDHPISVRLGDFDDDGDLDAVSLEFGSREINLHENAGDGVTWTTSTISTLANRPSDAVVHDVDLDGDLDVVIITSSDLVWLQNRINQTLIDSWVRFDIDTDVPAGWTVAVGDLDGDGEAEIVGGSVNTPLLAWWDRPALITTAWTRQTIDVASIADLDVVDADGDGDLDVLASRWNNNGNLRYWQNDGSANFTSQDLPGSYLVLQATEPFDIDNDGDLDFLFAGGNSNVIDTLENLTVHSRVEMQDLDPGTVFAGSRPLAFDLADFDRDGDLEIISYDEDERLRVRESPDDAGTLLQATSASLNDVAAFELGDIDNDGDIDVVMGLDDGLEWLENNGVGFQFSRNTIDIATQIEDVLLVDLNRSGSLDVVGYNAATGRVRWWRSPDDGNNWIENQLTGPFTNYQTMTVGDTDGVGQPEIIIAADLAVNAYTRVADIAFARTLIATRDTSLLGSGDFDRDGDLDLVGYDFAAATLRFWENDGSGGTWTETALPFEATVQDLAVLDYDRDGDLDVIGTSFGNSAIVETTNGSDFPNDSNRLRAKTAQFAVGDLNRDGFQDLMTLDLDGALQIVEAEHGQFRLSLGGGPLTSLELSQPATLATLNLEHLGRPGDQSIGLEGLTVRIERGGVPLTDAEAEALILSLSLVDVGAGGLQVAEILAPDQGSPFTFNTTAAGVDAPADEQTPSRVQLELRIEFEDTFDQSFSSIDVTIDGGAAAVVRDQQGVLLTPRPTATLRRTYGLTDSEIFSDDFESNSTSAWSSTVP